MASIDQIADYLGDQFSVFGTNSKMYTSVTESYNVDNILQYNGKNINPANFTEGAGFLVIMSGGATYVGEAIYYIFQNANGGDFKDVKLASNGTNTPKIGRTSTTNSAYAVWTSSRTANMYVFIMRVR